ncbi:ras-related protein Rap-1b [Lingula anatina]|uniref:Ras-related protein Rap-1b n=1 Tax=Lingula anatina TaxID=7574 RepID=A0A1S3HHK2_LINAN|nr:ras-related protein Rap-1b [Lingula anatina]|eukprot:XP_013385578.1 ras-related protein Rap-1b [Lingula anatina]
MPKPPMVKCPSTDSAMDSSKAQEGKRHYRIVILGPAKVGKTSIISQFLYENFQQQYVPTVEELHRSHYEIDGMKLTLDIIDTSGEYEFPAMRRLNICNGDAFVLVYSLADESTLDEVKKIRQQILDEKKTDEVPIVIVGNKSDIADKEREMQRETVETVVNIDWGNGYVESSAQNNKNIDEIFKELLVQSRIQFQLSPAIRRRKRQSVPNLSNRKSFKQTSGCIIS